MEKNKPKLHYGFVVAAAIFIEILICGGIFFGASGVFIVPVTASLGIGQGDFSMYLTVQSITMALTMFAAPKLIQRVSYRKINAVSVLLAGGGFALMGFANGVLLLYVGGALIGIGCVFLCYLISGTLLPRWFKRKLGTVMAAVMSGLGVGGIIFNPVIFALINSGGVMGFEEGWRSAYVLLGVLVVVVCLPLALFVLRDHPSDKGLAAYGEDTAAETSSGVRETSGVSKDVAIKSPSFMLYVLMLLCTNLAGGIMTFLPAFASISPARLTAGFDLSGMIGSVGMFGAILGGFIIGAANDKFGAQGGALTAGAFGLAGFILLLCEGATALPMLGGAFLYGIFYQINQVQMPAMVTTMYGEREYDRIFPVGAAFGPWIGAVSYTIWGFIYDSTGSYTAMLVIGVVLCSVAAVFGPLAVSSSKKLPRETSLE